MTKPNGWGDWRWGVAYGVVALVALGLRFYALTDLPPTLWVDEAWFSLRGRDVATGLNWMPLEKPGLGVGNSPFQIYLTALMQWLGYPLPYSARAASAFAGWLVVVSAYPIVAVVLRSWLGATPSRGVALGVTALLAGHFTGLLYSRNGLQMSGTEWLTVLFMGALYLTFERGAWRWAVLSGVLLAVSQTTYEAALGLLLAAAAYVGVRWLWPTPGPLTRPQVLGLGGAMLLAGVISYLPFILYYYFHPGIFLAHAQDTGALGGGGLWSAVQSIAAGLTTIAWGISIQGDYQPGRNLAYAPLLEPLTSIAAGLGVAWVVWSARRQPAAQLLLVWIGMMALPPAASDEKPAFSRMLPMVPALLMCAGLGGLLLWRWMTQHLSPRAGRSVGPLICGLALVWASVYGVRQYFVIWPRQPTLFDVWHQGARLTAERALAEVAHADVWLSPQTADFVRDPFAALLAGSSVRAFDASPHCLPYADQLPRDAVYGVVQVMDPTTMPLLQAAYPQGHMLDAIMHSDGYSYALFFRVPAVTPAPAPEYTTAVNFGDQLRLVGYTAPSTVPAGQPVRLTLFWEANGPSTLALTNFVHIGKGRNSQPLIAQADASICPGYTSERWLPGYQYRDTHTLNLDTIVLPDTYDVRVGVYLPDTGQRLTAVSSDLLVEDDRAILAEITVTP